MSMSKCAWLAHALAGAAISLGVVGCGESVDVVPVDGTLTRGGKPVSGFIVTFQPTQGRPSVSGTDENGHFELKYTLDKKGALRGKHKVHVQHPSSFGGGEAGDQRLAPADVKDILAKYGSVEVTTLEVNIDGPQTIELKLD